MRINSAAYLEFAYKHVELLTYDGFKFHVCNKKKNTQMRCDIYCKRLIYQCHI